jgi:hypothetical protein
MKSGTWIVPPLRQVNRRAVLYRFGVFLAANDHAHRLFPELSMATEQDLARWHAVSA